MRTVRDRELLLGFQLGLDYALVGRSSLEPLPRGDELLSELSGERLRALERGQVRWSIPGPRHSLRLQSRQGFEGLAAAREVLGAEQELLAEQAGRVEGRLLPAGMHPWMPPAAEPWPHGGAPAEQALHHLFGSSRHGWSNQQGLHLSLAFASEAEFARLYAALRFAMPLMPALAASSPLVEGRRGPAMSCRLAARRDYFASEPDFESSLVPEPARGRDAYRHDVLGPLQRALSARGLKTTLSPHHVSAHGLRADFDAGLLTLEMLDRQECLSADLAVVMAVAALAQVLMRETAVGEPEHAPWPGARLAELVELTLVEGEEAVFRDADYLRVFGFPEGPACRARELWQYLVEERLAEEAGMAEARPALSRIIDKGSLASRCLAWLPQGWKGWNDEDLHKLAAKLCECLAADELL